MNLSIEEQSNYWQKVLWVRCKGDRRKAVEYLVARSALYPHSAEGRFATALLYRFGRDAMQELEKGRQMPPEGPKEEP